MTDPARTTKPIADVQTDARSTVVSAEMKSTSIYKASVMTGLRELAQDTRLLEEDIATFGDAPSSSFHDLDEA